MSFGHGCRRSSQAFCANGESLLHNQFEPTAGSLRTLGGSDRVLGITESGVLKWVMALCAMMLISGCATMNYSSSLAAAEVSECIAAGWRKSARSGAKVPVSLTKTEQYYFVGVELHPTFPSPVVTGTEHPFYAVWAEVRDAPLGSSTRYHRAYQFTHGVIDRVVVDCQKSQ